MWKNSKNQSSMKKEEEIYQDPNCAGTLISDVHPAEL
jgi:hypothetical protein